MCDDVKGLSTNLTIFFPINVFIEREEWGKPNSTMAELAFAGAMVQHIGDVVLKPIKYLTLVVIRGCSVRNLLT